MLVVLLVGWLVPCCRWWGGSLLSLEEETEVHVLEMMASLLKKRDGVATEPADRLPC